MYVSPNIRTKAELRKRVSAGEPVYVFQPGGLYPDPAHPWSGAVEGPHYPEPHRWYAQVETDSSGRIVKVKK